MIEDVSPKPATAQDPHLPAPSENPAQSFDVDPLLLVLPPQCACCGGIAGASRAEVGARGTVIVPYCRACSRHAARPTTRALAVLIASALGGLGSASAVPLVWETAPLAVLAVVGLLGALLPLPLIRWRPRPRHGHSTSGRAVWWTPAGRLCCVDRAWAARLSEQTGVSPRPEAARDPLWRSWLVAAPLATAVLAPSLAWLHRPVLRVVNLREQTLTIWMDGRPLATVLPTSKEHPAAGVELRVAAGWRSLRAVDPEGTVVSSLRARFLGGHPHLYAPGPRAACFWLEVDEYGRHAASSPERRALPKARQFWVLPHIDSWFAPNPVRAGSEEPTSGGTRTALRQGPCEGALASDSE